MSKPLTILEQQARTLERDEQVRLAEMLLESLHDSPLSEIEAEWQREIEKRVVAYDLGKTQVYNAEEVFAAAKCLGE